MSGIPAEITVRHQDTGADRRHVADQLIVEMKNHVDRLRYRGSYNFGYEKAIIADHKLKPQHKKKLHELRAFDEQIRKMVVQRERMKKQLQSKLPKGQEVSVRQDPDRSGHSIFTIRETALAARDRMEGGAKGRLAKAAAIDELRDKLMAALANGDPIGYFPDLFSKIKAGKVKASADGAAAAADVE